MSKVTCLPSGVTTSQAEIIAADSYSRFPMLARDGSLAGYVHIKDLIEEDDAARDLPIEATQVRALPRIDADMPLRQALTIMQNSGAHLGAVISADGRVDGIVTLEDMLEELVGQIRDDSRMIREA